MPTTTRAVRVWQLAESMEGVLWVGGGLAVVWAAWAVLSAVPMSHDVAFFFYTSGRMLDGAKLYRDILEINPPLVYYFGVPPAWLARTLGLEPIPVFYGYCMVFVGAALFLMSRVALRAAVFSGAHLPRILQRLQVAELAGLIREYARGGSVYQLASTMDPLFPAINQASGRWLGHFPLLCTWLSFYPSRDPSLPRYNKPEEMGKIELMVFRTVIADHLKDPPKLLVVETPDCELCLPCKRFDFIEYFGQAKHFRDLMSRYDFLRQLTPNAGFRYAVYLRVR